MSNKCTWSELRSLCEGKTDKKSLATWLWLTPVNGEIPLTARGGPLGIQLREVADEMKRRGVFNKNGRRFNPHQLKYEIILPHMTDLLCVREGITPTDEQWQALYDGLERLCRVKDSFEHLSDNDQGRRHWKMNPALKRPVKRVIPWDRDRTSK